MTASNKLVLDVTIVGGGMITHDLLLPCIYHLQREGYVGDIHVCALNSAPLKILRDSAEIQEAFPGQSFIPHPDFDVPDDEKYPELFKDVLASMRPRNMVVVAMPDQLHYPVIMEALKNDQHVLCVKPLVQQYAHAVEIEKLAFEKGLFVGVEYHKRWDRRSLLAKKQYAQGHFGEFIMGEAKMIEPYFYRFSNFQNWFTVENSDPFTYVGCHYVDLVYYITGIRPKSVSVNGVRGRFPNGNEGFMWANGRVIFENGAILSVTDGLGYPDEGAGSNEQCLTMWCEGDGKSGMIKHNDQFRGVTHSYLEGIGCAGSHFNFVSPDFYKLVPWLGEGYMPVGYGYESVANIVMRAHAIESSVQDLNDEDALAVRQKLIKEIDEKGLIATPANSSVNELVMEAARLSILNDGAMVDIIYDGENSHVKLR